MAQVSQHPEKRIDERIVGRLVRDRDRLRAAESISMSSLVVGSYAPFCKSDGAQLAGFW
jgi:hypothetical protein